MESNDACDSEEDNLRRKLAELHEADPAFVATLSDLAVLKLNQGEVTEAQRMFDRIRSLRTEALAAPDAAPPPSTSSVVRPDQAPCNAALDAANAAGAVSRPSTVPAQQSAATTSGPLPWPLPDDQAPAVTASPSASSAQRASARPRSRGDGGMGGGVAIFARALGGRRGVGPQGPASARPQSARSQPRSKSPQGVGVGDGSATSATAEAAPTRRWTPKSSACPAATEKSPTPLASKGTGSGGDKESKSGGGKGSVSTNKDTLSKAPAPAAPPDIAAPAAKVSRCHEQGPAAAVSKSIGRSEATEDAVSPAGRAWEGQVPSERQAQTAEPPDGGLREATSEEPQLQKAQLLEIQSWEAHGDPGDADEVAAARPTSSAATGPAALLGAAPEAAPAAQPTAASAAAAPSLAAQADRQDVLAPQQGSRAAVASTAVASTAAASTPGVVMGAGAVPVGASASAAVAAPAEAYKRSTAVAAVSAMLGRPVAATAARHDRRAGAGGGGESGPLDGGREHGDHQGRLCGYSSSEAEPDGGALRAMLGECTHVVEVYGLTTDVRTSHLEDFVMAMAPQDGRPLPVIKWVDDNHALLVCPDRATALFLLQEEQDVFRLRPFTEASAASKAVAAAELLPPRERPKTTAAVAKKMLSHALGMSQLRDKAAERELAQQRKAAREARREREQKLAAAWDDD